MEPKLVPHSANKIKNSRILNAWEVDAKMEMGLCFLCDEPFTLEHQSAHKNIRIVVMEKEEEELVGEGAGPDLFSKIDKSVALKHKKIAPHVLPNHDIDDESVADRISELVDEDEEQQPKLGLSTTVPSDSVPLVFDLPKDSDTKKLQIANNPAAEPISEVYTEKECPDNVSFVFGDRTNNHGVLSFSIPTMQKGRMWPSMVTEPLSFPLRATLNPTKIPPPEPPDMVDVPTPPLNPSLSITTTKRTSTQYPAAMGRLLYAGKFDHGETSCVKSDGNFLALSPIFVSITNDPGATTKGLAASANLIQSANFSLMPYFDPIALERLIRVDDIRIGATSQKVCQFFRNEAYFQEAYAAAMTYIPQYPWYVDVYIHSVVDLLADWVPECGSFVSAFNSQLTNTHEAWVDEQIFYTKLEAYSNFQSKAHMVADIVNQNFANILLKFLSLYKACHYHHLIKDYDFVWKYYVEMAKRLLRELLINQLNCWGTTLAVCCVGHEPPEDVVSMLSGHVLCYQCLSEYLVVGFRDGSNIIWNFLAMGIDKEFSSNMSVGWDTAQIEDLQMSKKTLVGVSNYKPTSEMMDFPWRCCNLDFESRGLNSTNPVNWVFSKLLMEIYVEEEITIFRGTNFSSSNFINNTSYTQAVQQNDSFYFLYMDKAENSFEISYCSLIFMNIQDHKLLTTVECFIMGLHDIFDDSSGLPIQSYSYIHIQQDLIGNLVGKMLQPWNIHDSVFPYALPAMLRKNDVSLGILHRKMIKRGHVMVPNILLKWKALPPKHGTWELFILEDKDV